MDLLDRLVSRVREKYPEYDHIPDEHIKKMGSSMGWFVDKVMADPLEWRAIRITGMGVFKLSKRALFRTGEYFTELRDQKIMTPDQWMMAITWLNQLFWKANTKRRRKRV